MKMALEARYICVLDGNHASRENHHFELVFRNRVLSEKPLRKMGERKGEIAVESAL